jgi:hypothetical protein
MELGIKIAMPLKYRAAIEQRWLADETNIY